jgi:hypothetical protein
MRTGEAFYPGRAPSSHRVPLRYLYVGREPSTSQPDQVHVVRQRGDGSWECTNCLGYDYGHECKHIRKHRRLAAVPQAIIPGMLRRSYP